MKCPKKETPEKKLERMQSDPVWKVFLSQMGANLVSNLVITLYSTIDTVFIGQYIGEAGLASLAGVSVLEVLLCNLLQQAVSIGASTLIGPEFGKKNLNEANRYFSEFLTIILIISCIIPIVLLPWSSTLIRLMGVTSPESQRMAKQYFWLMFSGGPLLYGMSAGMLPLFRQENQVLKAMIIQIISSIINIIVDAIIFPVSSKKLEMFCPAISTYVSLIFSAIVCVYSFMTKCSKSGVLRIKAKQMSLKFREVGQMLLQGLPYFLNSVPSMFGLILINSQIAKYSATAEDAQRMSAILSVHQKISYIVGSVRVSASTAFLNVMSYNVGARRLDRVSDLNRIAHIVVDIVGIACSVLVTGLAKYICLIFNSDPTFAQQSVIPLMVSFFGLGFGGTSTLCGAYKQVLKKPWTSVLYQMIRFAFMLICIYVLPLIMDIKYILLSISLTETIIFIPFTIILECQRKEAKRFADGLAPVDLRIVIDCENVIEALKYVSEKELKIDVDKSSKPEKMQKKSVSSEIKESAQETTELADTPYELKPAAVL